MPDVGSLNIEITSNAAEAAAGLGTLAKNLGSVKKNADGFDLTQVQTNITNIVNAVKGSEKTMASLGTLFNSMSTYFKTFGKITSTIKINTKPIEELQTALKDGINIGNAGSQMNHLRSSLEGEWNTDNAYNAGLAISAIAEGAKNAQSANIGQTAKDISALSKSLTEYAKAAEKASAAAETVSSKNIFMSGGSAEARDVGANIGTGIAEGVRDKIEASNAASAELAHGAIETAKQELDEHSPSKEFKIIGEYIVEGMIEGILSKKKEIENVMADLAKGLTGVTKGAAGAPGDWRGEMMGLGSGASGKQSNTGVVSSIKKLTDALQGANGLSDFAKGLADIAAAIENGANSYRTLGYLATSIEKLKKASQGFKLPDFSRLENLARVLQDNFNAENGLKRIAAGMEAIKKANEGFKMPSNKSLEKIMSMTSGPSESAVGNTDSIEHVADTAKDATEYLQTMESQVQENVGNITGEITEIPRLMAGSLAEMPRLLAGDEIPKLMEGAMEPVKESISEMPRLMSGEDVPKLLAGSVDGEEVSTAIIAIEDQTKDLIVYADTYVDSWKNLCRVASEAKQRLKEATEAAQPNGYGSGRISNDMYAATDMREHALGPALRGEEGYVARMKAKSAIENATGLSGGEVNKQLADLANDARQAKKQVDELMDSLNKPIPSKLNWSQGIDRMLGIGAESKSAAESASAFDTPMSRQVRELMDTLNTPIKMNWSQATDQLLGINEQAKSAQDSMSAFLQGMNDDSDLARQLRELNPELVEVSKKFQDAGEAQKAYVQAAKDAEKNASSIKQEFEKLKKTVSGGWLGKLAHQFTNIAKRMAIRAIIKQVSGAFKEGVENVYRYNQAIGGSFATDMDNAASSLFQMKNAIGAAVAPAIQMVIPYIQQLVNWFITAVNYVNQFLALLNGQSTWTKALPVATKAFDDQKKKAKGASDAMKDLLADWDELNIIQSQGGGGGGGALGAEEDYANMFEQVSTFDNTVKDIANVVKDVIGFVKENFAGVLASAIAIKTAMKAWKISSALKEAFPLLSKLVGGLAVGATIGLTIGITDLTGKKFTDTGNPAWLIADALTGAVGAKLAGSLATKLFGASAGSVTAGFTLILAGATNIVNANSAFAQGKQAKGWALAALGAIEGGIGTALSLKTLGAVSSFSFAAGGLITVGALALSLACSVALAEDSIDWGTVELTHEQVEEYVQTQFFDGIDVVATINLVKATIDKVSVSKAELEDAVGSVIPILTTLKLGIDDESTYEDLKKAIFGDGTDSNTGLIGKIQQYAKDNVQELKTSMALIPVISSTGEDMSAKFTSDAIEGWGEVEKYTRKLGDDLGVELAKGFTEDGLANFDEEAVKAMTEKLVRISKIVTGAQIESAAEAQLSIDLSKFDLKDADEKTALEIANVFSNYKAELEREYEGIYKESANQYLTLSRLYEEMAKDANTEEEKQRLLGRAAQYKAEYDEMIAEMAANVEGAVMRAAAPGIEQIRDLIMSKEKFADVFNLLWRHFDNNGKMEGSGQLWSTLLGLNNNELINTAENDIDAYAGALNHALASWLGGENLFLGQLIKQMPSVNIWSLMTEEMQEDFRKVLSNRYGEEYAEELIKRWVGNTPNVAEEAIEEAKKTVESAGGETSTTATQADVSEAAEKVQDTTEAMEHVSEAAQQAKQDVLTLDDVTMDTTGLEKSSDTAASAIEEMASRIRAAFATLDGLSYEMDVNGSKYAGAMRVLIPVQQRAMGGPVKSGDLVMANENGNFEMMGRMGNQPVVANNQQIIAGITSGVSQANEGVESRLTVIEGLLTRILSKEFVAKAVPSAGWGGFNSKSNREFEKVTG